MKWIDETHSIELKTKKCYQNGWRLLKATKLSKMKLDEITNRDGEVVSFPGGPSNANQALRTLRRMVGMAKEDKKLQNIPRIKLRKEWGRSIAMSIPNAEKIASHMDGDLKDAFVVIRGGGVRPEETFSLRWEYIQWENKIYQNPNGKSERSRRPIPLICWSEVIDPLAVLLRRHVEQGSPSQGWVFPSSRSRCGHLTTIKSQFNAARSKAGLPNAMVLYTGRQGAGTDLAKITTLKQVMDILGHTQAKTAMRYQTSRGCGTPSSKADWTWPRTRSCHGHICCRI